MTKRPEDHFAAYYDCLEPGGGRWDNRWNYVADLYIADLNLTEELMGAHVVYDIGSSYGRGTEELQRRFAKNGIQFVGITPKVYPRTYAIPVVEGVAEELSYVVGRQSSAFPKPPDVILMRNVLHHILIAQGNERFTQFGDDSAWKMYAAIFREAMKTLRPGGKVLIFDDGTHQNGQNYSAYAYHAAREGFDVREIQSGPRPKLHPHIFDFEPHYLQLTKPASKPLILARRAGARFK